MSIKTKIFNLGRKIAVKVGPHAPTLLLIGGVIAGGAAIYEVAKSSMKAPAIIEKHTESLEKIEDAKEHPENFEHEDGTPVTEESYKRDRHAVMRSAAWDFVKLYWKSAALIVISITLIFSGFKILNGRLARSAALATSLAATNDHIKNNIIAKYGAEEYRNLRFSSKDDILKQVEAPDVKPADQNAYKDPFRSYADNAKKDSHVFEWNERTVDASFWVNNSLMNAMRFEALVNTINTTVLPEKRIMTINDVLDALHMSSLKRPEFHDEVAAIYGKNTIDLGIEDFLGRTALYGETDYLDPEMLGMMNNALDCDVFITIDPIGDIHDQELMKNVDWRHL